jgi:anti-sigma regulatory factor (Ser/Thr protein kinase)
MADPPASRRSWSTALRAGPTTSSEARWFLLEALRDEDVASDVGDAALLATEVASNAAHHGREPIEIGITLEDEGLRVSVFDRGPGFDPTDEAVRTTGSGINLIEALASEWGVDRTDDGTDVWFRI